MSCLGNIIWIIFGGLISAVLYFFLGVIWCCTIIGIPFGLQCFKYAQLVLAPFGKNVNSNFSKHPIVNTIWMIFGGIEIAFIQVIFGALLCITVIGIPFGLQYFKLAKLAIFPFGANIR